MNTIQTNTLAQFLSENDHLVCLDELYIEFNSHPDFPSFQSITDTLDHFNIRSLAASIPKEQFGQIYQPVLVHLFIQGKEQLVIVEKKGKNKICISKGVDKGKQVVLKADEFINLWDGNLIAVEKNDKKRKLKTDKVVILITLLAILILYQQIEEGVNIRQLVFQGLAGPALFLSYLVIKTTIGSNLNSSKFCSFSKSTDCGAVVNSVSSKIFETISLSDLSLVYFLTVIFFSLFDVNASILAWISVLALPIVIYSIYQQGFVLKKWCPLCPAIALVLCSQFLVILPDFQLTFVQGTLYSIGVLLLVCSVVFISWQLLKPLLTIAKESIEQRKELKTFKRNYRLFIPYFNSLPILNTAIPECDIHYSGSPNAPIKILVITNPFCKHCKEVHHMLERLRQKYVEDVSINLRFYTPQTNLNDPRVLVSCGMLKAYELEDEESFHQLINTWYEKGDVKSFLDEVNLERAEDEYLQILEKHARWCIANGIGVTPVLLVNNRIFPLFYQSTDLEPMVGALIEELESSKLEKAQPV